MILDIFKNVGVGFLSIAVGVVIVCLLFNIVSLLGILIASIIGLPHSGSFVLGFLAILIFPMFYIVGRDVRRIYSS